MLTADLLAVYVRRLGIMLLVALPVVAIGAGVYDSVVSAHGPSLLNAVVSSIAITYLVAGAWLAVVSILHTATIRGTSSPLVSMGAGLVLACVAGTVAAWAAGYKLELGGYRLPLVCGFIGAVYGYLVLRLGKGVRSPA
jgi:hypothetical protein